MEEAQIMTPLVRIEETQDKVQHTKYELISTKDVVTQMLFLGSQDASFVNGEVLIVDGGLTTTSNGFVNYVADAEYQDNIKANQE